MTGLESSVSAIFSTSASTASVTSPSISSSNRLPWRTSVTPEKPSRGSAPSTALPWGSRISGLGMTSTTTRATGRSFTRTSGAPLSLEAGRGRLDRRDQVERRVAVDDALPVGVRRVAVADLRQALAGRLEQAGRQQAHRDPGVRRTAEVATHEVLGLLDALVTIGVSVGALR